MGIDYPRAGRSGITRWLPSWKQLLAIVVLGVALVVGLFFAAVATTTVPKPNEVATAEATIVYWRDGTELGRLGDTNRRSIPLSDVPIVVQHAVLSAEDRAFYEHGGFSPVGIARALVNNVTTGSSQGGSTITQQYAKNAYLTQEKSWSRKLKELVLAVKLETTVSKDQILEDYLNTIYFGRGAYGIEAAARAYFGVPAKELTLEQGAVLAAIIQSPGGLAPEDNLKGLKARWTYVLDGMVEKGWLTPKQRKAAKFPTIPPAQTSNRYAGQRGYLLTMIRQEMRTKGFTDAEIDGGGLRITSTFDKQAEAAAVNAVKDQGPQTGTKGLRIGLVSVQPGTGEVVAVYGGPDYLKSQINNATRPFAQAGSTFKPFALTAALENGIGLDSMWDGASPQTISGYTLTNYGDESFGQVSLLKATESSINTAYVNVENTVGVDKVAEAAVRVGVPDTTPGLNLEQPNLTFVLGTASPSGLAMADAYATFAAQGARTPATVVKKVVGANGGLLYVSNPQQEQVVDSGVANTVTFALSKVVTDGSGFAAQALGRPAAGKTGTTDNNRSAWFVGYTPQLATAVLMAKEDASGNPVSMSGTGGLRTVTGGSFPARMWTAFMQDALKGQPVQDFPAPPPGTATTAPSPSVSCPTVLPTDGTGVVPSGCPTPSPTGSPTDTATATASPTDTGSPTPSPTDTGPTAPPTDTGAPTVPPTDTAVPSDTGAPPPASTSAPPPPAPSGPGSPAALEPVAPGSAVRQSAVPAPAAT